LEFSTVAHLLAVAGLKPVRSATAPSSKSSGQVSFFEADHNGFCRTSDADKKGKYQAQRGVTLPRL
jgi:deoxycytidine triphosphate deaminase